MVAQQTQKIASVSSGLEDRALRITDISREQYTRKLLKVVVEICTCCAIYYTSLKITTGVFSWALFYASKDAMTGLSRARNLWDTLGTSPGKLRAPRRVLPVPLKYPQNPLFGAFD